MLDYQSYINPLPFPYTPHPSAATSVSKPLLCAMALKTRHKASAAAAAIANTTQGWGGGGGGGTFKYRGEKKADEKLLIRISLFIINYSHRMRMWTGCRTQDTLPPELSATPHTKKLNIPEFNCCVMQLSRHSDIKYKAERKRCKRKHVKYFFESGEGGGEWKSTWTVRKAGRGKRKSENEIIVFFS